MATFALGASLAFGSGFTTAYEISYESKKGAIGNQRRRSSTAKRSRPRIEAGPNVVLMLASKPLGVNDIFWSTRLACCYWLPVHSAGTQDRDGARSVLEPLANRFSKLRKIWADSIYNGGISEWVRNLRRRNRIDLEIVKRPDGVKGFLVLARRWVVERTFAWLSFHRQLSKDYEYLPETSEAFIRIAMIRVMLRRLRCSDD